MRVPYIAAIWDTTPVTIRLTDGMTSDGAPNVAVTYNGKCNFSETVKTVRKSDGTLLQAAASLTIGGDIAPALPALTGSADLGDRTWQIASASRPRNPDGTVHHTALYLT